MDSVNSLITTLEMAVAVIPVCSPNSWPLRGALLTLRAATKGQSKPAVDTAALKRAAHNLNRARHPAAETESKVLAVARMAMSEALHRVIRSAPSHRLKTAVSRLRVPHLYLVEPAQSSPDSPGPSGPTWQVYEPPELTPCANVAPVSVHS